MKFWKIGLLLAVMSCITKNGTNDTESKAIEEYLLQYYKDMSNRDWERYRSYFWENATITTAWQKPGDSASHVHVISIDEFIKETPNGPDSQPVFEEKMTRAKIQTAGNLSVAWVEYEAKFGKPDSLRTWSGTDLFTFMMHNNEQKIVALVFESN